jgi:hypothetical protein
MQEHDGTKDATSEAPAADQYGPQDYAILVKGHLDARWAASFTGLSLTTEDDGTTLIHGPIIDQAALHGLLQTLRDIGAPLLAVTRVRPDAPDLPTTEH